VSFITLHIGSLVYEEFESDILWKNGENYVHFFVQNK